MSNVRVTCLLCDHPVEVAASDVVLHLEGSAPTAANRYGFTCPTCTIFIVRPAGPEVVDALLAADIVMSTGTLPPWESAQRPDVVLVDAGPHVEGIARPDAPALTEADATWFNRLLQDDDAVAAWLS